MKYLITAFLLLSFSNIVSAQVSDELIKKVAESKQALSKIEQSINKQSLAYQNRINKQLARVKALREQASAIQRVADEQILGVDQLSERVNKWRAQDNYQKLLLQSYFEQSGVSTAKFIDANGDLVISDAVFASLQGRLLDSLVPDWQAKRVVSEAGDINEFQVLSMGPVSFAYNQNLASGGVIEQDVNQALPSLVKGVYNANDVEQLAQLSRTGLGHIMFDPTLGNAAKLADKQQGIVAHIEKGGVWALPILFFGALSLVVALAKSVQLLKLPKVSRDLIDTYEKQGAVGLAGAEKRLVEIASNSPVSDKRDDQLIAYLMQYRYKVENYLGVVATSAAIAPLLGLLGTVSGMINTFMMMNTFGTGDAATVSGGISEALVTTELGLIVAIPSLILSALLSRKAKSYNAKLETNAIVLSKYEF